MEQPVGVVFTCLLLLGGVAADVYFHVPRGANNRLDETSANRKNAQRLYNSQNNDKGGYNVGDLTDKPFEDNADKQYQMKYFQSGPWRNAGGDAARSFLNVEWTNQHGCGNNQDTYCNLVLQYMCQDDVPQSQDERDIFRNGVSTNKQDFRSPRRRTVNDSNRKRNDVKSSRGLHESWEWYNKCYLRERNNGLFRADQNLRRNRLGYTSAIHTRQGNKGTRYGYECPEERDYYPYWHPNPWIDIAVMLDSQSLCSKVASGSFNIQPYHECIHPDGWSRYTNEQQCVENDGQWLLLHSYLEKATDKQSQAACEGAQSFDLVYKWAVPYDSTNDYQPECLVMANAPDCIVAPWTRVNHLGNTDKGGQTSSYRWTLPHFPSGNDKRCVLRIRYNISSADYDPFTTDSTQNQEGDVQSPIQGNPNVDIVGDEMPQLRLAVNTAQFGRTFQDRSHIFQLRSRDQASINPQAKLYNVNVRGKRGNIVQAYPAVEYDFAPTDLNIKQGDLVHFQWTGSNTHRNGNQAAGEGREGTDRSNVVEMLARAGNFPVPFDQSTLWDAVEVVWIYHGKNNLRKEDLAINMASSGYYQCSSKQQCGDESVDRKPKISNVLDNAPASYEGVVLRFTKKGTYHFMCTRNNNFSNRNQKAAIIVQ